MAGWCSWSGRECTSSAAPRERRAAGARPPAARGDEKKNENPSAFAIWVGEIPQKTSTPPQPKPSAEVPPPGVYQPVREVPELPDVPDLHRWPLFGCSR